VTDAHQQKFSVWLKRYEDNSREFSICNSVEQLGNAKMNESAQKILQIHNKYVLNEGKKLA